MRTAEYIMPKGHIVRVHDHLDPGTPEYAARQKRWEKAVAEFAKSVPSLWQDKKENAIT
ncbi:MAG: hypothetical protein IKC03_06035 [Oscillospiraceae bacterium]|nr:hypothetical protein [Oscillospiraceae bacterium]